MSIFSKIKNYFTGPAAMTVATKSLIVAPYKVEMPVIPNVVATPAAMAAAKKQPVVKAVTAKKAPAKKVAAKKPAPAKKAPAPKSE
jgi:hypothetical protein